MHGTPPTPPTRLLYYCPWLRLHFLHDHDCKPTPPSRPPSPPAEFTGSSAVLDEVQKRLLVGLPSLGEGEARERQRWGRLAKMKGDMCLLCGSPRDAAEHYK